jgi:hypothetical protein
MLLHSTPACELNQQSGDVGSNHRTSIARQSDTAVWPEPDAGEGPSLSEPALTADLPTEARLRIPTTLGEPASGDKRVSDQQPDACFHGRMVHQPHARFATLGPAKGCTAALVLSPNLERPAVSVLTIAFDLLAAGLSRLPWRHSKRSDVTPYRRKQGACAALGIRAHA